MVLWLCLPIFGNIFAILFLRTLGVLVNSLLMLQRLLCENDFCEPVIELNSSVKFVLNASSFCVVDMSHCNSSVFILKNSHRMSGGAVITCDPKDTMGVAFTNSHVSITNVTFENCGAFLKMLPRNVIDMFNSSSSVLNYQDTQAAGILFVNCIVDFFNVTFARSFGFSVLCVNVDKIKFHKVALYHSSTNTTKFGSGIIFHFMDRKIIDYGQNYSSLINVSISQFESSSLYFTNFPSLECPVFHPGGKVESASGITFIFSQKTFHVHVSIVNTTIHRHYGSAVGAILIVQFNLLSTISVSNCLFLNCKVFFNCLGTAISYILDPLPSGEGNLLPINAQFAPLSISGCIFDDSNSVIINNSSLLNFQVSLRHQFTIEITVTNSTFHQMQGTRNSGCLFAKPIPSTVLVQEGRSANLFVILENLNVTYIYTKLYNIYGFSGIFKFYLVNVEIRGSSSHFSNNYGSIISAISSNITLSGNAVFMNNNAANGAAISISGTSQLYFRSNLNASFINNSASLFGGAIYAATFRSEISYCPFYFDNLVKHVALFIGNRARLSGDSIYSKNLEHCCLRDSTYCTGDANETLRYLKVLLRLPQESGKSSLIVSTIPVKLNMLTSHSEYLLVFPGQTVEFHLVATDKLNRPTYSPIQVQIDHLHGSEIESRCCYKAWIASNQKEQLLVENQNFTSIKVSVYFSSQVNFRMHAQIFFWFLV